MKDLSDSEKKARRIRESSRHRDPGGREDLSGKAKRAARLARRHLLEKMREDYDDQNY